jgi:hypothetical protein
MLSGVIYQLKLIVSQVTCHAPERFEQVAFLI